LNFWIKSIVLWPAGDDPPFMQLVVANGFPIPALMYGDLNSWWI